MPGLLLCCCAAVCLASLLMVQTKAQTCSEGFPAISEVLPLAENCSLSFSDDGTNSCLRNYEGSTHIVPELNFTCNGTIVMWMAAGRLETGRVGTNPSILIWRPSASDDLDYDIHARISFLNCNGSLPTKVDEDLYECWLDVGVPVQEGDVLGLEMPLISPERDQFLLYFDNASDTSRNLPVVYYRRGSITRYHLSGGHKEMALPLLTLGVMPTGEMESTSSNTPIPATSSVTITPATQTTQTTVPATQTTIPDAITTSSTQPQGSTLTLSLEESIGMFSGLLVVFSALSLLVCLQGILLVRSRRRNKSRSNLLTTTNLSNRRSMCPYATVDMTNMQALRHKSSNIDTGKSPTSLESVLLMNNAAYAKFASSSPFGLSVSGLYVSREDIRMRDGTTLGLFPDAQSIRRRREVEEEEEAGGGGGGDCVVQNKQIEADYGIHEQPDQFPVATPQKDNHFNDVAQE